MKLQEQNRRRRVQIAARAVGLGLYLIGNIVIAADAVSAQATSIQQPQYIKGRLLLQPRPGLSEPELDKILSAHRGKRVGVIERTGVHLIELPGNVSEVAVQKLLAHNPHFKFVELDHVLAPDATPNDTYYSSAWHLPRISAPAAWDYSLGSGVVIAIIDTGVNVSHPDLIGKVVPGWNVVKNSADTTDVYGHGTKVAGVAAGTTGNSAGIAGVGWFSKIMPVRIDDGTGYASFSAMAAGIAWAADHGAKVANVSYMGPSSSATVQSAAQYMRSKGGVVVSSAGNSNIDPGYLSNTSVTAVAATGNDDGKASFSNFGQYVDLAAPGVGIWSTTAAGGYASVSGTSFASPMTAGVYALMMSANPALSPSMLDKVLFSTALDLGAVGKDPIFGHGRINAAAAVQQARTTVEVDSTSPVVTITSPSAGARVRGLTAVNVSATDNVSVLRAELYVGSTRAATDSTTPFGFSWDTTLVSDGTKSLTVKAFDAAGNVGTSSAVGVTVANDTLAPTVTMSSPVHGSTLSGTVVVSASATDNKSVAKMALIIDGKQLLSVTGSTLTYKWLVPSRRGNKTSSTVVTKAFDPAGNAGQASATVYLK